MATQHDRPYYAQQSCFSDPKHHTRLFDDLPDNIADLCAVVRGLYIHYRDGKLPNSQSQRLVEADTRYISKILDNLLQLDNQALTVTRPIEKRFIGCCRDISLLLCSILRHKGIPARIRIGFSTYIQIELPFPYVDHVLAEYWDADDQRWKMVDAEQDERLIAHNKIDFDVFDIPHDKFLVGGRAWQIGRNDTNRWDDFGINKDIKGRWFVASYLMRDFAALNRDELLLWDTWGLMNAFDDLSQSDLELLDKIASFSLSNGEDFEVIRELYATESRLTLPQKVMKYSPVSEWREETLNCEEVT